MFCLLAVISLTGLLCCVPFLCINLPNQSGVWLAATSDCNQWIQNTKYGKARLKSERLSVHNKGAVMRVFP